MSPGTSASDGPPQVAADPPACGLLAPLATRASTASLFCTNVVCCKSSAMPRSKLASVGQRPADTDLARNLGVRR